MATAGAAIASRKSAVEVITAAAGPWPIAAVLRAAAEQSALAAGQQPGQAAVAKCTAAHQLLMLEEHVPVQVTQRTRVAAGLMPPLRITAAVMSAAAMAVAVAVVMLAVMAAAVVMPVAAIMPVAADTDSRQLMF
jgi:hypothetical protein